MGGTNPQFRHAALQIVSASQPVTGYFLPGSHKCPYGANTRAADGHLKRTFTGKVKVR